MGREITFINVMSHTIVVYSNLKEKFKGYTMLEIY